MLLPAGFEGNNSKLPVSPRPPALALVCFLCLCQPQRCHSRSSPSWKARSPPWTSFAHSNLQAGQFSHRQSHVLSFTTQRHQGKQTSTHKKIKTKQKLLCVWPFFLMSGFGGYLAAIFEKINMFMTLPSRSA